MVSQLLPIMNKLGRFIFDSKVVKNVSNFNWILASNALAYSSSQTGPFEKLCVCKSTVKVMAGWPIYKARVFSWAGSTKFILININGCQPTKGKYDDVLKRRFKSKSHDFSLNVALWSESRRSKTKFSEQPVWVAQVGFWAMTAGNENNL